jgi:hypothetical protein
VATQSSRMRRSRREGGVKQLHFYNLLSNRKVERRRKKKKRNEGAADCIW